MAGAIATGDGAFRIQGLRPGTYSLRVIFIGYGPKVQEFTISPAAQSVSAGSIKLSRVAVALQGVQVTGERATVSIEPDRNAYRAKDIAPAAGNASEVLDAVPSVQVDGDGKVSLRGNENVAVQINGRPSPIQGAQLGAFLKGLPANIVERIEVIPNPSAKYDPEGMAGIINIVLKQNTDLGLSAGARCISFTPGALRSAPRQRRHVDDIRLHAGAQAHVRSPEARAVERDPLQSKRQQGCHDALEAAAHRHWCDYCFAPRGRE